MTSAHRKIRYVIVGLAVLGGLLPPLGYWAFVARVPSVDPDEAKEVLGTLEDSAALVDVRAPDEFAIGHLEAAESWPLAEIMALASADQMPPQFAGKRLLLICNSGIQSVVATRRLRELGEPDVWNVRGGMQAWVAAAERPCTLGLCRLRQASGAAADLPYRDAPPLEQATAVLTGFFIKPLYTVLSLALVIVLWRATAPDLVALRWAMIAFFVGENFCAANYVLYSDGSLLFEYLHSYGMVLCFGLAIFALLEGMDLRLIKLSDEHARCAALSLCRRCIKHVDVPCGLQRTFVLLIPATAVLALLPFCADPLPVSYNTRIFNAFYNYSHPVVNQIYEIRVLPIAALALLAVAWVVLLVFGRDAVAWSKAIFAAGAGALGFSLFRLILYQAFRDDLLWYATWEEVTELLFIISAGAMLWIFRHGLFAAGKKSGQAEPASVSDAPEASAT